MNSGKLKFHMMGSFWKYIEMDFEDGKISTTVVLLQGLWKGASSIYLSTYLDLSVST